MVEENSPILYLESILDFLDQFFCPGNLEQNGIVERKHQHNVETVLDLLFHANVLHYLMVDVITMTLFLIKRMSPPVLHNKSPF